MRAMPTFRKLVLALSISAALTGANALAAVTDQDIAKKTSYAVKIGAITDPAHSLKLKAN